MHQVTTRLSDEQLAFYEREGYIAVEALTTPEEVAELREIYDRLFAERAGRDEGMQFDLAGTDEDGKEAALPQILQPAKYAPQLNETQLLKNATMLTKQLLGDDAQCAFAHAIYKPPRIGAETPWHQDAAYWPPDSIYRSISIWVPLQEASLENGCMWFVPRSQEMDVVRHRSINNDPRVHGLELHPDELGKTEGAVACPLPPGGCTIHGAYTLHYAGANRSHIPRRALILSGSAPGRKRERPVRFEWLEEKQTARMERANKKQAEASA